MLIPLLNVNMKTTEVEGDQRKHQGAVDKSLRKNRSVLQTAIAFHCAKTRPIHQVLVGLTAVQQVTRQSDENV